jgi:hypothetical protein
MKGKKQQLAQLETYLGEMDDATGLPLAACTDLVFKE